MTAEEEARPAPAGAEPLRTDPRGFLVRGLTQLLQGAVPGVAALFGAGAVGAVVILGAVLFGALMSFGFAWLSWRRLTYLTGPEDIRVEHGLLSRNARSVPYERIQDVSIEQKWLPRLLGLAEVKFETGAGGKEEISLAYLSLAEAERLRTLVRERKEGAPAPVATGAQVPPSEQPAPTELLFAMDNRRLVRFGLFEFSLVIFAVLLGAAQQLDFLFPFKIWDWDSWRPLLEGGSERISGYGRTTQVEAALGALLAVVLLGMLTGIARTFAREYDFRLELTPRGFRRRRGLFNKSDVLLPVPRVQAARVRTGLVRYRFGWHALDFVSLAQDEAKSGDHVAAPFARLDEIWPIVRAAGIAPPPDDIAWHRPSARPWLYDTLFHGLFFTALAIGLSLVLANPWPLIAGGLAVAGTVLANYLGWRRHRHAIDDAQLYVRAGALAPHLALAPMVKLQSVEIAQSPLGRWRGYAKLRLGLAGGRLELVGLPLAEARAMRAAIVEKIAAVDFSRLPG